jgi:alpha-ketoglutarate-dependent taurine dioxygenase
MPQPKRPLTDTEAAQLRAALSPDLAAILDNIITVHHNCYSCEHRPQFPSYICKLHNKPLERDKMSGAYGCWEHSWTPF